MRRVYSKIVNRVVTALLVVLAVCGRSFSFAGGDLEYTRLENAEYKPHAADDGDSFYIAVNSTSYLVRLYGVDCPETQAEGDIYIRRVREQTRYFGLDSPWRTVRYGLLARDATRKLLSEPFTVYTVFTPALGQSPDGRIYVFVVLSDGRDLSETLVKMGLARAYGVSRRTPSGESRDDYAARLKDLEMAAAMKRVGIWQDSDPERLVAMRAEERRERNEFASWSAKVSGAGRGEIDLNTADEKELQLLSGIGPTLARRIVEGRPYKSVDDLANVRGVSKRLMEELRPFVTVGNAQPAL
jgi:DNA uptake protein ComE-like DNA-binding protein